MFQSEPVFPRRKETAQEPGRSPFAIDLTRLIDPRFLQSSSTVRVLGLTESESGSAGRSAPADILESLTESKEVFA
jgi:hypothetical protein